MSKIQDIYARELLDSRGNPTIEVDVVLESGAHGSAIVPSGASTGVHEAVELRDGDPSRYLGKGVKNAVQNVQTILWDAVKGMDANDQEAIDIKMIETDGTPNKGRIGANAILGVSLAVAKANASANDVPLFQYFNDIAGNPEMSLPTPMMNVINGGEHSDAGMEIQEFMIFPTGAETFSESMQIGAEVFHTLKNILSSRGLSTSVGDEGGFAPHLETNEQAIELILEAAHKAGHLEKIQIALDAAASEFFKDGVYTINRKPHSSAELRNFYIDLLQKYPIISIEDAFAEDDFEGFKDFTALQGSKTQIVGDDLFVTNPSRLEKGIEEKMANSLLVKFNQVGTLTETIRAVQMTKEAGWTSVMSHRSGETEDTTIADLAVGLGTGQIKTGSLSRSDRIAKYNQLLRIEEFTEGEIFFNGKIR